MFVNILVSPYNKIAHLRTNKYLSKRVNALRRPLLSVAIVMVIFYKTRPQRTPPSAGPLNPSSPSNRPKDIKAQNKHRHAVLAVEIYMLM